MKIQLLLKLPLFLLLISTSLFSSYQNKEPITKPRTLRFFTFADYTYWKASQQGLDVLFSYGSSSIKGNVIQPNSTFQQGCKFGIGIQAPKEEWSFSTTYTLFYNHPGITRHTLKKGIEYLSPFSKDAIQFTSFLSQFANCFHRLDSIYSATLYNNSCTLQSWIGCLGAIDKQSLEMEGATAQSPNCSMNIEQKWYGIGPYSGLHSSYNLTSKLAFFLKPGVAVLFSHHKISNYQISLAKTPPLMNTIYNYGKDFNSIAPMLEISMGFKLHAPTKYFDIKIQFGWDMQSYFSHSAFPSFNDPTGKLESYCMHGLSAGILIAY